MAYTDADTRPKVGFRPYLQTNPRGAANLSGLDREACWKLGQVRAFDPWILHGPGTLGQGRPFDQDPHGWRLHGLGQGENPPEYLSEQSAQEVMLQGLVAQGIISASDADGVRNGAVTIEELTSAPDPLEESSWSRVLDLFAKANNELLDLEQRVRDDPDFALIMGRDVAQARTRYTELASEYIQIYATVFGSTPKIPGLGSLGAVALLTLAVGAAVFITIVLGLYILLEFIESRPAVADAGARQAHFEAIKKAEEKGDVGTATALSKQPPAGKPEESFLSFIQHNAKWIALTAVGLVVAGPLTEGIFGGRRRR